VKKFVYVILSAFLVSACNINELEFDNLEVQPITGVYSFPLGKATYIMRDLIGKQTGDSLSFQEDSTSLLTLLYYDTITYGAPDDFVQIFDIVQNGSVTAPPSPAGTPRTVPLNNVFNLDYNPQNGEELDSVYYQTGDLTIVTTSTLPGTLNYTYTITNTTNINNGNPVILSGTVNNAGSDTQTQSLVDHKTILSSATNVFTVNLNASVALAATDALTGTEEITFSLTYGNQTFNLIYGKFGKDTVQVGNQSIDLDFFSQSGREGITFGNPSISFDFRSSFGLPVGVDFSGLSGDDGSGGDSFNLTGDIVRNMPTIDGSGIDTPGPNTPGETVQSSIEINRSNSNIVALLGSSPSRLVFDVAGISNPVDVSAANYVQPTSQIQAFVTMEVPFEIQMENLKETGSFNLGDGLDLSNIDSAFIRIVTENELPFNGTISLDIQDEDSVSLFPITDTTDPQYDKAQVERLTNIPVIKAPLININGEVTDPSGETEDIYLTKEEVELLSGASHVIITMTLNTPASQTSREIYVKILAKYSLTLKVGIGGKFNLDF
jgi:hypothetical protein